MIKTNKQKGLLDLLVEYFRPKFRFRLWQTTLTYLNI